MSKSRAHLEADKKPTKKRLILWALQRQRIERELKFFPQPDPPLLKPLG